MNCSVCGKPVEFALRTWQDDKKVWHCEHDPTSSRGVDKMEKKRRENLQMTLDAKSKAAKARTMEDMVNPETTINPIDKPGNRSQFGQSALKVRKSVIESLKEKSPTINPDE